MLKLLQNSVAAELHVNIETYKNWERGVSIPTVRQMPQITQFLGYNPEPVPSKLSDRIRFIRRETGLTQKQFSRALNIDMVTLYRWEKGLSAPSSIHLERIREYTEFRRES